MKDKIFEQILKSIEVAGDYIKIDGLVFPIKNLVGQGYHKQVFEIDDGRVLKIVRKDSLNLESAFLSFQQAIENQKNLDEFGVNYAKILEFDKNGPPYRFLIQEKIADNGISAVELIKENKLEENDITQMAKIINKFEIGRKWQIDTSPFNWFKVENKMIYTGGSIYEYDEQWSFKKVGLLQWLNLKFISDTNNQATKIPSITEIENLAKEWENLKTRETMWWKKYLDPKIQPKN